MSEHTPGPWGLVEATVYAVNREPHQSFIADVRDPDDYHHKTDVAQANARLVAAAPDLLDVAENALREFSHILDRYDFHDGARHEGASLNDAELMSLDLARVAAKAAIAKARGES